MLAPKKILVLVADDDEDSRIIYTTMLQHHGYVTIPARDGEEALRLTRKYLPQAVVTDVWPPRLDGCEVAKAIKQDPETAHIPTLVITADARPETRARAKEAGCDVFVLKPSHPQVIVEKVRELVRPPRPQIGIA